MSNVDTETEAELGTVILPEGDEAPPPEKSAEDLHYEERARRMGWRDKDDYSGRDKSRWVDARTFVQRGENELPIVRERMRKLDTDLVSVKTELKDTREKLSESAEVLKELRTLAAGAEQRGFQNAMREIQARERKAVAEADTVTFDALQQERQQLEASRPKAAEPKTPVATAPPPPAAPATNPIIDKWVADNTWFNSDQVLHAYALAEDAVVERENPGWGMEDKLEEVKRRVVARFPEKFDNPRRQAPPAVVVSSGSPPKSKGKTVKDLPADARKALDKIKKSIPGYKDEEYLRIYFAEE